MRVSRRDNPEHIRQGLERGGVQSQFVEKDQHIGRDQQPRDHRHIARGNRVTDGNHTITIVLIYLLKMGREAHTAALG